MGSRSAGFVRWIRAGWAFALASALPMTSTIAQERSLTIDDVLGMESFGDVSLSPDGHWLVYERRRAFDSAPRFDRGHRFVWAATDLFFLDLHRADEPMRLIHTTQEEGLVLGPWSPSGAWLLVYRVGAHRLEGGVLSVKTRADRWTGLTPDMPLTGSGAEWRDDNRLLLTTRPVGAMPWMLERDGASQASTRRLWRDAAEGRVSSATRIDTFGGIAATTKEKPPQRLMEIDALSGEIRQVAEASILDMSAAPDGKTIALLVSGEGIPIGTEPVRAYEMKHRTRLRLLDAASGSVIAAPTQDIALHLLRWTSRSDAILVWGRAMALQAWDGGRPHAQTGGAARQNGRTPRRRRRTRNASARAVLTDYCENRVTSWRGPEIRTPLLGVRAIVSASSSARSTSSRRGGGAISHTSFWPLFDSSGEKETDRPSIR